MFKNFYLNIELLGKYAKVPTRAHSGDAGLDVYATKTYTIKANSDILIPLGWRCEFPEGFVMTVKEKSGRAVNNKLTCGACIIDSLYRGVPHVHLFNNGSNDVLINRGEKIAQLVITKCWDGFPKLVKHVNIETDRNTGGFGSTGIK